MNIAICDHNKEYVNMLEKYFLDKNPSDIVSRPPKVRPKSNDWEVGFSMAKYSYEFKKKVVQAYLDCKGGYEYLAMYYGTTYYSFEELKEAIEKYIKYYNEKRIKEKLVWMSPVQYRLNALAA